MALTPVYRGSGLTLLGGLSAPEVPTGQAFRAGLATGQQRRQNELAMRETRQNMQLRAREEARRQQAFEQQQAAAAAARAAAASARSRAEAQNRSEIDTMNQALEMLRGSGTPTGSAPPPSIPTPSIGYMPANPTAPGVSFPTVSFPTSAPTSAATPGVAYPVVTGGAGDTALPGGSGEDVLAPTPGVAPPTALSNFISGEPLVTSERLRALPDFFAPPAAPAAEDVLAPTYEMTTGRPISADNVGLSYLLPPAAPAVEEPTPRGAAIRRDQREAVAAGDVSPFWGSMFDEGTAPVAGPGANVPESLLDIQAAMPAPEPTPAPAIAPAVETPTGAETAPAERLNRNMADLWAQTVNMGAGTGNIADFASAESPERFDFYRPRSNEYTAAPARLLQDNRQFEAMAFMAEQQYADAVARNDAGAARAAFDTLMGIQTQRRYMDGMIAIENVELANDYGMIQAILNESNPGTEVAVRPQIDGSVELYADGRLVASYRSPAEFTEQMRGTFDAQLIAAQELAAAQAPEIRLAQALADIEVGKELSIEAGKTQLQLLSARPDTVATQTPSGEPAVLVLGEDGMVIGGVTLVENPDQPGSYFLRQTDATGLQR